jgi:ribosome maturation factor RimP
LSVTDRVRDLVLPLLRERSLDLYDVEQAGPVLRVVVDTSSGLDLDVLADATRAVSRALDEADPISGRYTLEVTSPGLERPLRTPQHFARAVGEKVKVKTAPGVDSDRRVEGILAAADPEGIAVRTGDDDTTIRRLGYGEIDRARTVFDWGPSGSPGRPSTAAGKRDEKRQGNR